MSDAFNKRLQALGSTRVQWIALYYLGLFEGISQNELAEKMNVESSTVVRLIDRMERDGYLKRVKDPNDRRITALYLTQSGEATREKLLPEGQKMSAIFTEGIDDEDVEVFLKVLTQLVSNASKWV